MKMRAIQICPQSVLRSQLEQAAEQSPNLALSKSLDVYPEHEALSRMIRIWAPEVVFLSLEDPEAAAQVCQQMDAEFPNVQRVAISDSGEPPILRLALRLRVREVLVAPFRENDFNNAINEIEGHLEKHPANIGCSDRLFAFVPAKAGVGTSVLAAGFTRAVTAFPNSRPLLMDFDMHSGVGGFLFNVEHEFSVSDAVKMSGHLDDESWGRLIKTVNRVDLLLSGAPRLDDQHMKSAEIANLLGFVRRNYTVISVDLPDTLDGNTLAVLREANRTFLVTTAELPSLRLAHQKMTLLRKLDMEDRVSLLVTRTQKRMEVSIAQIEEMIGVPVAATFPSEYRDVVRSIREGTEAESLSPALREFAQKVLNKRMEVKKTRFIQQFALVPARYGFR